MKPKPEKTADKLLRDRVEQQLDWEPEVTSTKIGVAADDGIVTLSGYVDTYSEKLAAEKAALRTFGVKAVANDIAITPLLKVTDTELAATVAAALRARSNVPAEQIKITVKDGRVYLEGTVAWKFQRDAAENAVSHIYGMVGVVNRLEVKPAVSAAVVQEKIEGAFRRNAELDARRINVSVTDDTVELIGNVRNWLEKDEADHAAWAAPGVRKVINNLTIVP